MTGRDGLEFVAGVQIHQFHAHRVAAGFADVLHAVRTIWPPTVMTMISSASRTESAPMTPPVFSPTFIVMRPLPPRDCLRVPLRLDQILFERSALADAVFAGNQQRRIRHNYRQRNHGVIFSKVMPLTPAAGGPSNARRIH